MPTSLADNTPSALDAPGGTIQLNCEVPVADPTPQLLGPYELREQLGQGAMGEVYRAVHTNLERTVALKLLPDALVENSNSVDRFQREMKAVGRLDHPNVVRAHDANQHENRYYIAMEFVDGSDLQQLVEKTGPLPINVACDLVAQAAAGLQHIHENDLVHRDIKPSNLMLSKDGVVKILDLGIAKLCDNQTNDGSLTQVGTYFGTPDYISPEQIATTADVDIRADIYSLGCTAYQLMTGEPPYGGTGYETNSAKLIGHTKGDPEPVHVRLPACPKELSDVIGRMIAVRPEDRFQEPIDVHNAIQEWANPSDTRELLCRTNNNPRPRDTRPTSQNQTARGGRLIKVLAGVAATIVGVVTLITSWSIASNTAIPDAMPQIRESVASNSSSVAVTAVKSIDANTGAIHDTLLKIESTMQTLAKPIQERRVESKDQQTIAGTYLVAGQEPDGTDYTGKAMIIAKRDYYTIQWWWTDGTKESGRGLLQDGTLTIDYGSESPAIYKLQEDGRLVGTYDNGLGKETMTPGSLDANAEAENAEAEKAESKEETPSS